MSQSPFKFEDRTLDYLQRRRGAPEYTAGQRAAICRYVDRVNAEMDLLHAFMLGYRYPAFGADGEVTHFVNREGEECEPSGLMSLKNCFSYPRLITGISTAEDDVELIRSHDRSGRPVRVRTLSGGPAGDGETFTGIMLGDMSTGWSVSVDAESGELQIGRSQSRNPAMWVPALSKIVMGYESYWAYIEEDGDEDRDITNEDISNVWYVKALKGMADGEA